MQFPLSTGMTLSRDSIVGIPVPCSISLPASIFTPKDLVEKGSMSKIAQLDKKRRADRLGNTLTVSNKDDRLLSSSHNLELATAPDLDADILRSDNPLADEVEKVHGCQQLVQLLSHDILVSTLSSIRTNGHVAANNSHEFSAKTKQRKSLGAHAKEVDVVGIPTAKTVPQCSGSGVDDENEVSNDEVPLPKISMLNSNIDDTSFTFRKLPIIFYNLSPNMHAHTYEFHELTRCWIAGYQIWSQTIEFEIVVNWCPVRSQRIRARAAHS
ncbi:hypothetical protein ZWY2020_058715 [Hordeum vulgare]|nr:hypothetical protein ZWY2020_058715 [Hordeum vulgare]